MPLFTKQLLPSVLFSHILSGFSDNLTTALRQAAPPNPEKLADAILRNEHERSKRQGAADLVENIDLADLLLDGVAMLWRSIGD